MIRLRVRGIQALWLLCIPLYAWGGTRPDGYARAVLGGQPPYPVGEVLSAIAVTTVESLVLYVILRPKSYERSWRRAAGALLIFVPWFGMSFVVVVHASPIVFLHMVWVLLVNLILLGLCTSALVQAALGTKGRNAPTL